MPVIKYILEPHSRKLLSHSTLGMNSKEFSKSFGCTRISLLVTLGICIEMENVHRKQKFASSSINFHIKLEDVDISQNYLIRTFGFYYLLEKSIGPLPILSPVLSLVIHEFIRSRNKENSCSFKQVSHDWVVFSI